MSDDDEVYTVRIEVTCRVKAANMQEAQRAATQSLRSSMIRPGNSWSYALPDAVLELLVAFGETEPKWFTVVPVAVHPFEPVVG